MSFIRKIKNRGQVYYAEVENRKVNGKVVQRYIRYVGKRPDDSRNFTLDTLHFGYIATRLMQGDLTQNELLDMLERMRRRVPTGGSGCRGHRRRRTAVGGARIRIHTPSKGGCEQIPNDTAVCGCRGQVYGSRQTRKEDHCLEHVQQPLRD